MRRRQCEREKGEKDRDRKQGALERYAESGQEMHDDWRYRLDCCETHEDCAARTVGSMQCCVECLVWTGQRVTGYGLKHRQKASETLAHNY